MPAKNPDLHGSAPDKAPTVLLLIDVINDLEFEGGEALLAQALPMADRLAALKRRLRARGVQALEHMRRVLKAELTPSTALDLSQAA